MFEEMPSCKFNTGVECPEEERKCYKCGWNPKINISRMINRFGAEDAEKYLLKSIKCRGKKNGNSK